MAKEIERKFLIRDEAWKASADGGTRIGQAFLSRDPQRTVRVRLAGVKAFLTIKGQAPKDAPLETPEFEYAIPQEDARHLLKMCLEGGISKTRYRVPQGQRAWEIDVFDGANAGLIMAEIELGSASEAFDRPKWLGEEVTDDPRYKNANLSEKPYSLWGKKTG